MARNNSTRLPGKVLFEIGKTSILGIVVEKLKRIKKLKVIIATSVEATDDPIDEWCKRNGVDIFRGSLDNVAERISGCLQNNPNDAFFRINADSPFLQPGLLTRAIEVLEQDTQTDIVTNVLERSYPYGIAVELIKSQVFIDHAANFNDAQKEHITSYFYKNHEKFKIKNLRLEENLSSYKFVLDSPEDWETIQDLYHSNNDIFNLNIQQLITIKQHKN